MSIQVSRLWDALVHKRRASVLDVTSRCLSGVGILPSTKVLRGITRELEFLEHPLDSVTEFYDGAAITYPSVTQIDSSGSTLTQHRGYPRAGLLYCLHDVKVETRYGIPWNRNRDVLLGVHNGDFEKEAWESWARNPTNSPEVDDLIVMPSTSNYFHWLIEQVPGVLRAILLSPKAQVVISADAPGWMMDACQILQIPVIKHPPGSIRANRYTTATRDMQNPLTSDLQLLRASAGVIPEASASRHLMISRRNFARFDQKEVEVERALVQKGFEVIHPETLSFLQQVKLFSEAAVIVGSSGAALSNLVWTSGNVKVVVLKPSPPVRDFLWNRVGPRSASYWSIMKDSLSTQDVVASVLDILE